MPLIEIRALPQPRDVDIAEVARAVNRAVSTALGCRLDAVWTTWQTIDGRYARGDDVAAVQQPATHDPIVHVFHHRTPAEVAGVVEAIETTLTDALGLEPGTVFITTQPVRIELDPPEGA